MAPRGARDAAAPGGGRGVAATGGARGAAGGRHGGGEEEYWVRARNIETKGYLV